MSNNNNSIEILSPEDNYWLEDEDQASVRDVYCDEHEHVGWPGDGSGEDDFADYNQNEADDYYNE